MKTKCMNAAFSSSESCMWYCLVFISWLLIRLVYSLYLQCLPLLQYFRISSVIKVSSWCSSVCSKKNNIFGLFTLNYYYELGYLEQCHNHWFLYCFRSLLFFLTTMVLFSVLMYRLLSFCEVPHRCKRKLSVLFFI